jgi:hypothetical protein
VFVSFRSADAGSYAAVLLDEVLGTVLGPEMVFRSSRSIAAGRQFDEVLLVAVQHCDAMVVLIGPDWLTAAGEDGQRLLERPDDWVRREVEIALGRSIPVVPVLLTGARRPERDELPRSIAALASRQAVYLRHRHIGPDLGHLLAELVRVAPGLGAAQMFAPPTALPEVYLPSMLLRPEYGVVPFTGRQAELADLLAWCTAAPPVAARLLTAPAGQGKTRLALRLCELVRRQGWLAGVVPRTSPRPRWSGPPACRPRCCWSWTTRRARPGRCWRWLVRLPGGRPAPRPGCCWSPVPPVSGSPSCTSPPTTGWPACSWRPLSTSWPR